MRELKKPRPVVAVFLDSLALRDVMAKKKQSPSSTKSSRASRQRKVSRYVELDLDEVLKSLRETIDRLLKKYPKQLAAAYEDAPRLAFYLGETLEDFDRLHPLLRDICECKIPRPDIRKRLLELGTWSGHLADELNGLKRMIMDNEDPLSDS